MWRKPVYPVAFRLLLMCVLGLCFWYGWIRTIRIETMFTREIGTLIALTENGDRPLKMTPHDSWDIPYQRLVDSSGNLIFYSTGPDGKPYSVSLIRDDIFLSTNRLGWLDDLYHILYWRHLGLFLLGGMAGSILRSLVLRKPPCSQP